MFAANQNLSQLCWIGKIFIDLGELGFVYTWKGNCTENPTNHEVWNVQVLTSWSWAKKLDYCPVLCDARHTRYLLRESRTSVPHTQMMKVDKTFELPSVPTIGLKGLRHCMPPYEGRKWQSIFMNSCGRLISARDAHHTESHVVNYIFKDSKPP